jgi:hypothetical protein
MSQRISVSANFFLDEFIDPVTYSERGAASRDMIDRRLIDIAQFIRTKLGRGITVNNWFTGGRFKESGLRRADTKTGRPLSQHKIGKAIDVKASGMTGADWRKFVEENAKELFNLGVRRIEDESLTPTWLHIDLRPHDLGRVIRVVDLTKETAQIKA